VLTYRLSTVVNQVNQEHPIKLFYTSNIPIILQTAMVSNLYFLSQLLWKRFPGNFIIGLFGAWRELEGSYAGHSIPVGGIMYYMTPPNSMSELLYDPFHTIIYLAFVLGSCALFSRTWIQVSGSAPKDVARQLRDQQMMMRGYRDSQD